MRYSTEEQDASSIPDQFEYCKRFLQENGIQEYEIVLHSDPEMSGELVSRPGINKIRDLIAERKIDLLLCEDSSRLFRHVTACSTLVETAVDLNIRVICINDDVDTAEDDWDDRLNEAMQHHSRSNKYTAKRIKRKLESLWRFGAAVGVLRPGYRRIPSNPATATEPASGPFHDKIDPKWAPVIREIFERVARHDKLWEVALWATEQGVPKSTNAETVEWRDDNILNLIRNSVYRGTEVYRKTIVKKKRKTGKPVLVPNVADDVLSRETPDLRVVTDGLWYAANQAIDARRNRSAPPRGEAHRLFGIPRDSRGPLSGIFFCGICGGKMHVNGRRDGGYRCSNASRGLCWNKTNPRRSVVHEKLGKAIAEKLLSLDGALDLVITQVLALLENGPRSSHRDELLNEKANLERAHARILEAIETSDKSILSLTGKLAQREHEIAQIDAELTTLETSGALCQQLPSKDQIKEAVMTKANALLCLDRSVRADLRQLVGTIRAVPYQQFGTSTVVLRAYFELRLAAILPNQFLLLVNSGHTEGGTTGIQTFPMTVDLFELTRGPARFWLAALDLHRKCLTAEEIAKELGTNRATANRSVRYATALCDAGLSDPFIELTDAPSRTGRWRFRTKNIRTIITETAEYVEPSRNDVREAICQRVP